MQGVDKAALQPDMHWRYNWPQGIDDGTDDDKVMSWWEKPKDDLRNMKFWNGMREWTPGTWPIHHSWNDDYNHATYHQQIDDGTDDNEVLDLQLRRQI